MIAPVARGRTLLALLLLLAALHAASAALIRPIYQVSDEVNYLASARRDALSRITDPALAACISPPDGEIPNARIFGGKALFHRVAGGALTQACRFGAGDAAPIVVRLLFSLSLVVVTWCGWQLGALLSGGTLVPALTALGLATHPVLAKYAAGVTPDSLANACAAVAILQVIRWLVLGPSARRLVAVVVATGLAAGLKDSALVFVPIHGLVLASSAFNVAAVARSRAGRFALAAFALAVAVGLALVTRTNQQIGPGVADALASPLRFVGLVLNDTLTQLPAFLASAWTSLGGFGAKSAELPTVAATIVVGLLGWAIVGLLRGWGRQAPLPPRVLPYLVVLGTACLLQAPVRLVLLSMTDLHQGRWLFPMAVPVAFVLARGLAAAGGARLWPLTTMATLTVMMLATTAVLRWHVTSSAWGLDHSHLYLHSTGGIDIGVARTADQVRRAWQAVAPLWSHLALLCCTICGALLLWQRPEDSTRNVHHAHHR